MVAFVNEVLERIERCLDHRDRLTVGEIAVLEILRDRDDVSQSITFVEEQQIQQVEQKLGLP